MPTARHALCAVVRVHADERPPAQKAGASVYAVFTPDDDAAGAGRFLGLVTPGQTAAYRERIFADLLLRPAPAPVAAQTPLPDAVAHLDREKAEVVAVLEGDGTFLGAVTRASLLDALLQGMPQPAAAAVGDLHTVSLRLLGLLTTHGGETELLQNAIESLAALIGARYAAIGLLDDDGQLKQFVHTGIAPEEAARIGRLPEGKGLLGVVIHENHALRLDDMSKDPRAVGFPPHHPPMKSLLAVPVSRDGRVYGRAYLSEKTDGRPFTDEDEQLVTRFAEALALTLHFHRAEAERLRTQSTLQNVAHAVSAVTGQEFFRTLVLDLAKALNMDFAFVGELAPGRLDAVQTIAVCAKGRLVDNFTYELKGTPCNNVVGKTVCHYPHAIQRQFPDDHMLREMGIDSYVGYPLFDATDGPLGLLVVMDSKPMRDPRTMEAVLQICAARGVAEIERRHAETEIHKLASAVEQTADSVLVTDVEGVIQYVNTAYEKTTGYSRAEAVGWKPNLVKSGHHDAAFYQRLWATIRGGEPFRDILVNRRKNGELYYEEKTITPLKNERGEITHFVSTGKDITERMRAEQALREQEERFRQLAENIKQVFWMTSVDKNQMLYVSPAYEKIWGRPCERLYKSPRDWLDAIHPNDRRRVLKVALTRQADGTYEEEYRIARPDGAVRWIRDRAFPIRDKTGAVYRIAGIAEDVTEAKQAENKVMRLGRILERSSNEIYVFDADTLKFTQVNEGARKNLGYTLEELHNLTPVDLKPAFTPQQFQELIEPLRRGDEETLSFDTVHKRKDGSRYPVEVHLQLSAAETPPVFVAVIQDISERQQAQERLNYLAYYDALTGLPNRLLLLDRLKQAMIEAERHERLASVLFLDLDRFKLVNDTLGHVAGDVLLKNVAGRLTGCVRLGDTVARLGGDEFTIVLANVAHVDDVGRVARKIIDVFAAPFLIAGQELFVSPSIGITLYPFDDIDPEALLKNADVAMYHAKDSGRNTFQFFTPELNQRTARRLGLETALRHALERDEFLLHYQPQVNLASGRVTGVEALIRWQRPDIGMVSPLEFIPLAEETGLIVPIGDWVLRTACAQARAWQQAGLPALRMSVNVAARQFQQQDLAEVVTRVLRETGLEPRWLTLEITESTIMHDAGGAIETLQQLGAMGVGLSLDDFGTGYSSLNYLKRFPLDCLKIDKSFVDDITTDHDAAAIASAIISMARSLEVQVVAEGVETRAQLEFLRAHGCGAIQGYYFSKPLPAEACERLLREDRRLAFGPVPAAGSRQGRTAQVKKRRRPAKKTGARLKRLTPGRKAPAKK